MSFPRPSGLVPKDASYNNLVVSNNLTARRIVARELESLSFAVGSLTADNLLAGTLQVADSITGPGAFSVNALGDLVCNSLVVNTTVSTAGGALTVDALGNLVASSLVSNSFISALTSIVAGTTLTAGTSVAAGTTVSAGTSVIAGTTLTAQGGLFSVGAGGGISAAGGLFTVEGTLSATPGAFHAPTVVGGVPVLAGGAAYAPGTFPVLLKTGNIVTMQFTVVGPFAGGLLLTLPAGFGSSATGIAYNAFVQPVAAAANIVAYGLTQATALTLTGLPLLAGDLLFANVTYFTV